MGTAISGRDPGLTLSRNFRHPGVDKTLSKHGNETAAGKIVPPIPVHTGRQYQDPETHKSHVIAVPDIKIAEVAP